MIDLFSPLTGSLLLLLFAWAALVSLAERELKAAGRYTVTAIIFITLYSLLPFIAFPGAEVIRWSLVGLPYLAFLVLLIPVQSKGYTIRVIPKSGQDERDTMFSRKDLIPGTDRFKEYYRRRPENRMPDDNFRAHPGLLQPGTLFHNPLAFASADASFSTVDLLHSLVESGKKGENKPVNKTFISRFIKGWGKKLGAVEVGIANLKEYHFYAVGGRKERYDKKIQNELKHAIVFTVEMDDVMMSSAPAAPTIMESAQQYLTSGIIAIQIAECIRNLGYSARAHIDANYELICPIVARDAGLGEIGRMGLLMTSRYGPRVRIAAVTTDLPLESDKPSHEPHILDFCQHCRKCADVCPAQAISFDQPAPVEGVVRWKINSEACYTYWTKAGTDCGRCVVVCPFSHPDTLLHLLVRKGIKNSVLFSRFALHLDHLIYGNKPGPGKVPVWIPPRMNEA